MKVICVIVLLFFASGCGTDRGKGDTYFYSISNKSNRLIVINSYRSGFPNSEPIATNLEIGETIEKVFKDGLPPTEYNFKHFLDGNGLNDSLVITCANEKMAVFKEECNVNDRNPIDICIYGDLIEDFVFTEEDYANAMDCDGPCE